MYELEKKNRGKTKQQVEAAERRRSKDTVVETLVGALKEGGRSPGRPKSGAEGPKTGSLRAVEAGANGLTSRSALSTAASQTKEDGKVRDRRERRADQSTHWGTRFPRTACSVPADLHAVGGAAGHSCSSKSPTQWLNQVARRTIPPYPFPASNARSPPTHCAQLT